MGLRGSAGKGWLTVLLACALGVSSAWSASGDSLARLGPELARIDAEGGPRIGVYVRDLATGASASHHASEHWYLASTVKVPIAIAVLRGIARGDYDLETPITLRATDYVDGAGRTNSQPVGTGLSIRFLMEQMIIHSDNTASDMLIGLVGLPQVNAVVQAIAPDAFGPITTLAEVRRATYGHLVPGAQRLAGRDLLVLRQQRTDDERLQYLARVVRVPVAQFQLPTLEQAYTAYYASGLNAGRLDAYGELLAQLVDGKLLAPEQTRYLMGLMERVATGTQRIQAGLPPGARFAHKTGTQRARFCDAGIVRTATGSYERGVLVVACTQGDLSLVRAERALRQVGTALCRSGLLTQGVPDAPACPVVPPARTVPAAGGG
ncbi:serine hydrolase [Pseudorhodoferax sp. Leaf267]|uniref:serine hydrolase n=1 Tax=Pseudorhodoferax sp. Leaf267 TaxID=1736316 RepID=UPI0006FDD5B3|nr:serine hydrolase [Pseudorhodoferax sp. Leaf267]KQP13715.1 serine hydrolase [Pseudorhodoferax sp. Leaf267]